MCELRHKIFDRRPNLPLDACPLDHLRCEIAEFHRSQTIEIYVTILERTLQLELVEMDRRVNPASVGSFHSWGKGTGQLS